jgi:hypothetical protein
MPDIPLVMYSRIFKHPWMQDWPWLLNKVTIRSSCVVYICTYTERFHAQLEADC